MKGNHVCVNIIVVMCLIFLIGCGSREPEAQQISEGPVVSDSGIDNQDFTSVDPTDSMTEKDFAENLL